MLQGNLDTTNVLLGVMAAVSLLEALVLLGLAVFGYRLYSRAMQTIKEIEQRQVAPVMARVNGILEDVKGVTARVSEQTERVDHAIKNTIDRVDETADRMRTSVRMKASRAVGLVRGLRAGLQAFFSSGSEHRPHAEAAGRL